MSPYGSVSFFMHKSRNIIERLIVSKDEILLKPSQVQQRLNVSRATLYNWNTHNVYLQPLRVGGSLRYRKSDVEKFINGDDNANGN